MSESEKTELEAKMKSINRAYKVLNDTYSRRIYDAGLDNESDFEDYFDSDTRSLPFRKGNLTVSLTKLMTVNFKL